MNFMNEIFTCFSHPLAHMKIQASIFGQKRDFGSFFVC